MAVSKVTIFVVHVSNATFEKTRYIEPTMPCHLDAENGDRFVPWLVIETSFGPMKKSRDIHTTWGTSMLHLSLRPDRSSSSFCLSYLTHTRRHESSRHDPRDSPAWSILWTYIISHTISLWSYRKPTKDHCPEASTKICVGSNVRDKIPSYCHQDRLCQIVLRFIGTGKRENDVCV
jgi:hypothetical protein